MNSLELLKNNGIRKTEVRLKVLDLFVHSGVALSNQDIEKQLSIDRITLYRTLNTFIDSAILHRIDDHTITYYALCATCDRENHNHDNHLHFKCVTCETIECFDQDQALNVQLPTGYLLDKINILIEGTCTNCS